MVGLRRTQLTLKTLLKIEHRKIFTFQISNWITKGHTTNASVFFAFGLENAKKVEKNDFFVVASAPLFEASLCSMSIKVLVIHAWMEDNDENDCINHDWHNTIFVNAIRVHLATYGNVNGNNGENSNVDDAKMKDEIKHSVAVFIQPYLSHCSFSISYFSQLWNEWRHFTSAFFFAAACFLHSSVTLKARALITWFINTNIHISLPHSKMMTMVACGMP